MGTGDSATYTVKDFLLVSATTSLPSFLVEDVKKRLESEARVRAVLARLRSVLSLPPPAASGPCLGALALVGVRGRPLLFLPLLFPLFFSPLLVRSLTGCRSRRATEPPVGGLAQASIVIQSSTSDL